MFLIEHAQVNTSEKLPKINEFKLFHIILSVNRLKTA